MGSPGYWLTGILGFSLVTVTWYGPDSTIQQPLVLAYKLEKSEKPGASNIVSTVGNSRGHSDHCGKEWAGKAVQVRLWVEARPLLRTRQENTTAPNDLSTFWPGPEILLGG